MRKNYAISFLLLIMMIAHLACNKSGAAALSQEDKFKLYYAAFMTGDKETMKDAIKRLGIGTGENSIPDHEFYIAFIDWMKTDAGAKFTGSIHSPDDARDYLSKNMPK
jgi:hypothetical protein